MSGQTVIPINIPIEANLESIWSDRNRELISELELLMSGSRNKRVITIWGETGSGKSHLLVTCSSLWQYGPTVYLSCVETIESESVQSIQNNAMVCLDDVHELAGSRKSQQAVLGIYEKLMAGDGAIVATSRVPINRIGLELEDLASRLVIGGVFNLHVLNDNEKSELLKVSGAKRGITLDEKVIDFIMSHYSRDMRSLFLLLDKLDSASLKEKRKITIPFVKSVLG